MIWIRRRLFPISAAEEGFTLIELMISLGMFAVAMMSMAVMFTTAFRTARDSQDRDRAKNLAQRKVEELRSLSYYIAFADQTAGQDPDLFDRFFPNLTAAANANVPGYEVAALGYRTPECFTSALTAVACPAPRAGMTRSVLVQFVTVGSDGVATVLAPRSNYDSNTATLDSPTQTARVTVTLTWRTVSGRAASYQLRTLVGGTQTVRIKALGKATGIAATVTGFQFCDGALSLEICTGSPGTADMDGELGLARSELLETDVINGLTEALLPQLFERDPVTDSVLGGGSQTIYTSPTGATDSRTGVGGTCPSVSQTASSTGQTLRALSSPNGVMAQGGSASGTACVQSSSNHTVADTYRSSSTYDDLVLNFGDSVGPKTMLFIDDATASSVVTQTATSVAATTSATLNNVDVWGTASYATPVLKIGQVTTTITISSKGKPGEAATKVTWGWTDLRIWDPVVSAYTAPHSCSHDGGGTYPPCATSFGVPAAYQGLDLTSVEDDSLVVQIGATQQAVSPDGRNASASQKNVLTIFMRRTGTTPLEPMNLGLGNLAAEVSYQSHHA